MVCSTLSSKIRKCSFSSPVTGLLLGSHTVTGISTRLLFTRMFDLGRLAAGAAAAGFSLGVMVTCPQKTKGPSNPSRVSRALSIGQDRLCPYCTPLGCHNKFTKSCICPQSDFSYNRTWRRWVFSSSIRRTAVANIGPSVVRTTSRALFSLLFPGDCRICSQPLTEISRIPVCAHCLSEPVPLNADFFCIDCKTPFRNRFPLDSEGRCALCRSGLRAFDAAYSFGAYEGVLRQLVHLLKYGKVKTLAEPLADLLSAALPRE